MTGASRLPSRERKPKAHFMKTYDAFADATWINADGFEVTSETDDDGWKEGQREEHEAQIAAAIREEQALRPCPQYYKRVALYSLSNVLLVGALCLQAFGY